MRNVSNYRNYRKRKPFALVYFAGGGVSTLGLQLAGFETQSFEIDPVIAHLHRVNCGECTAIDVRKLNPYRLDSPDLFVLTAPCQGLSSARSVHLPPRGDEEIVSDLLHHIALLRPKSILFENVRGYVHTRSFRLLRTTLVRYGYAIRWGVFNAADWGIPQTRFRLILIAIRHDVAQGYFPSIRPTHYQFGYGNLPSWVNWYDTLQGNVWWEQNNVTDLLQTLPTSHLTPRQIEALNAKGWLNKSERDEAFSSWLIGSDNTNSLRYQNKPWVTITTSQASGSIPRALLIDNQFLSRIGRCAIADTEPARTIMTTRQPTAILLERNGSRSDRLPIIRNDQEPAWTLRCSALQRPTSINAMLETADIRNLSTEALARLQTIPERCPQTNRSYVWTGIKAIDGKIIGNGFPTQWVRYFAKQIKTLF